MSFWLREIAGWGLILVGLFTFAQTYSLLLNKRLFEAGPLCVIGIVVFRGGTHLLKVAVAAQAARRLPDVGQAPVRRPGRGTSRPVGPTSNKAVLPGPKSYRDRAAAE